MNIISKKALAGLVLSSVALFGLSAPASAATYNYSGVITLCTATCETFSSLDFGTEIAGTLDIDTTAGGAWTFADVNPSIGYEVFNPAAPVEPFDGENPTTANPLPLNEVIAPIREVDAFGNMTGGTTNAANELDSGLILHEFGVEPFNNADAGVL